MSEPITLREFIEAHLAAHAREHLLQEQAIQLQAREYERRLDALNHEAARMIERNIEFVRVDKFDAVVEGIDQGHASWQQRADLEHKTLGARIDNLKTSYDRLAGVIAFIIVAIPVVLFIFTR